MSQRTIVEINHDVFSRLTQAQLLQFSLDLQAALGSSCSGRGDWFRSRYGVNIITQCHHSEDRKVVVGSTPKREYPFG